MSYDPNRLGGVTFIDRIKPFTAVWVGDQNGPSATSSVQDFLNGRRFIHAKVNTIAERDALVPDLQDGYVVFTKANGDGDFQIDMWDAVAVAFKTVAGGGAGSGVMSIFTKLGDGDGATTDYGPLPGSGLYEHVQVGNVPVYRDVDYTVITGGDGKKWIRFLAGAIPAGASGAEPAEPVWASAAITDLVGTDALTLGGVAAADYVTEAELAPQLAAKEAKGDLPFADHLAIGGLDGFAGQTVLDFKRTRRARTLREYAVTVPVTPASGSVDFEVFKVSAGGAPVTLFTGSLPCNGGWASAAFTRAGDALAAGEILGVKITQAPAGAVDFRAEAYE